MRHCGPFFICYISLHTWLTYSRMQRRVTTRQHQSLELRQVGRTPRQLCSYNLLEAGWTGIQSATIVTVHQFLIQYIKQLGHENSVVRNSVTCSLWRAREGFSEHMECAANPLQKLCPVHYTDHSHFIVLTHFLGIQLHFPPALFKHNDDIPMHKVTNEWQASQVHTWMSERYQARLRLRDGQFPIGNMTPCIFMVLLQYPCQRRCLS